MAITPEPVYIMLGDSIFNGEVTANIVNDLKSAKFGASRPAGQKCWNRQTATRETYNPTTNANRSGTLLASAGPDVSLMAEMSEHHPLGFTMIKRATFGAAMATESVGYVVIADSAAGGSWAPAAAENWTALTTDVDNAFGAMESSGLAPDVLGVFVCLGDNDAISSTVDFEAQLEAFVQSIRDAFSSRVTGSPLPIVWRLPQAESSQGTDAQRQAIRRALLRRSRRDTRLQLVNVDDLERSSTDDIHETPLSSFETGRRMGVAMRKLVGLRRR